MVLNYSFVLYTALDPTKLNKPRQFSRSTATPKTVDNSLWTETPAEKQQRLADEVMGKKRRVENADPDQEGDEAADSAKRRKREAELQRQVEEFTVRLSPTVFIFVVEQHFSDRIADRRCSKHTHRRMRSARKTRRRSRLGYGITRVIWHWGEG